MRWGSHEQPSQGWPAGVGVCWSQVWRVRGGAAAGAWNGLAPGVGACSGQESGEAGAGGGKPCLEAGRRSVPQLPEPLIPSVTHRFVNM